MRIRASFQTSKNFLHQPRGSALCSAFQSAPIGAVHKKLLRLCLQDTELSFEPTSAGTGCQIDSLANSILRLSSSFLFLLPTTRRAEGKIASRHATLDHAGARPYRSKRRSTRLRPRHKRAKAEAFAYMRLIRSNGLFSLSRACMSTVEGTLFEPGS